MRNGIIDLSMEFIKLFVGADSLKTRLAEVNLIINDRQKFLSMSRTEQFNLLTEKDELEKQIKNKAKQMEALDKMEQEAELKKTGKLEQFQRNQLRAIRPDDSGSALEIGNAQLAALERIEKNTYDQRRMTDMATRMSTLAMNLATNRVG